MKSQLSLWEGSRMAIDEALRLTAESLNTYGPRFAHWGIAYSGGKDSTAMLAAVLYLLDVGAVEKPQTLTVLYADTRMELPPLHIGAMRVLSAVRDRGYQTRIVLPEMDKRFFVYMLGRGVPPPNNNTFRWCTRQIKVDPMAAELRRIGEATGGDYLMLTGVRIGESAIRDNRIAVSCSRDGGECGQGWFQAAGTELNTDTNGNVRKLPGIATLAPNLHWRLCITWDWLRDIGNGRHRHGLPTSLTAEAYGADDPDSAVELSARTGCNGCPLATRDSAIDNLLQLDPERWQWLEPLKELRPLYRWLREPAQRLRMPGGERRGDGTLSTNQYRMGPLTMQARAMALAAVLDIQGRCNAAAGSTAVDMLNADEAARICELMAANTWPRRWTGNEPHADEPTDEGGATLFDDDDEQEPDAKP